MSAASSYKFDKTVACGDHKYYWDAAAGAAIAVVGLDTLLPLPAPVHWALGGVLVSSWCQEWKMPEADQNLAKCAAYAAGGGYLATMLLRR